MLPKVFFVTDVLYHWISQFKISCTNVWRRNSFSKVLLVRLWQIWPQWPWPLTPHSSKVSQCKRDWYCVSCYINLVLQKYFVMFDHIKNKVIKLQFQKWISSSYICATYFELTNPVVQNIWQKHCIMFYKHLLLVLAGNLKVGKPILRCIFFQT